MKEKINKIKEKTFETVDEYVEDAKVFWRLLKDKVNKDVNNPHIQKRFIIGASIALVITILIANIFTSLSYYYDESDSFNIIEATVGESYTDEYDYTLLVFLETASKSGIYELAPEIPKTGYVYNGYNCLNETPLLYSDGDKTASATISTKDVCSIYFNVAG